MTTTISISSSRTKKSQLYLPESPKVGTPMYPWANTPEQHRKAAAMHESAFAVAAAGVDRLPYRVVMYRCGAATEWKGLADLAHTTAIVYHRDGRVSLRLSTSGDLLRRDPTVTMADYAALFGAQLLRRGYRCLAWDGVAPAVPADDLIPPKATSRDGISDVMAELRAIVAVQSLAEQLVWQYRREVREVARVLLSHGNIDGDQVAAIMRRQSSDAVAA